MAVDPDETNATIDGTELKTMWSESLLESLYFSLRKQKSDTIVREIISDIQSKGYEDEYIINKVKVKVSPKAAQKVQLLLSGGSSSDVKKLHVSSQKSEPSKADLARQNAARKRRESGLVGKLKKLLGF